MKETEIQKEILDWLKNRGFMCWRNSNMPTRGRRNLTFVPRGMPDIFVLVSGRLVGLEVKTSGGRVSPEQLAFGDLLILHGGFYFVVRNLQGVVEAFSMYDVRPDPPLYSNGRPKPVDKGF